MTPTDKQAAVEAALDELIRVAGMTCWVEKERAALLALLAEPRSEGVPWPTDEQFQNAPCGGFGCDWLDRASPCACGIKPIAAAPAPTPTTGEAGVDVIGAIGPLPPPVLTIPLDADQAKELYAFMVAFNDDEFCQLSVHIGDGHSGMGLYISFTEYPDEGATFIAPLNDSPTPPTRPAQPAAWIIQTEQQDGKLSEPYALMGKQKHVFDAHDGPGDPIPLYRELPTPAPTGDEVGHVNVVESTWTNMSPIHLVELTKKLPLGTHKLYTRPNASAEPRGLPVEVKRAIDGCNAVFGGWSCWRVVDDYLNNRPRPLDAITHADEGKKG